jgi:phosphoserine phosphatase
LLAVRPELRQSRKDYFVVAYGDSRGDREMLDFADERHYKQL